MKITHVLRGEERIPTFPLHAQIYRAMGWNEPEWVHLSLFLKPSGKGKMSKRDTEVMKASGESIFIRDMKQMGYFVHLNKSRFPILPEWHFLPSRILLIFFR